MLLGLFDRIRSANLLHTMIGTKLAHYEITKHLGSGGMGDVYQATDSKLGRSVAIKFLPEAFNHDPDRVARFEREARVLASLNHPNIAAIYGFEQSAAHNFLVMELVPGETLAERIRRGPIPADEAFPIANQICDALEAAHEKGVVHRDLKPANVKVTPEGIVKVLDFGLAKAFEVEPSNASLSQSPTLSMGATNAGVILGTAAYMSPEQAKGRPVDKRTDIFAFGALLYEMLTGRPAFAGDDVGEILARVIEREPDWSKLPSKLPWRITELLRRCLEKDPRKRRRDAADMRIDIEQALAEPAAALVIPPVRGGRLAWIKFAAAVLVAVVLAIPTVRHLRETPPLAPTEARLDIVTPTTADPISFALSPDGRQIVFVASGDGASGLWVRSLASPSAQPLAGTEGASFPFWSPDSRSIGFFAGGALKRIDNGGGAPQTFATAGASRGGTWNADGVILFAPTNGGPLFRVAASGGQAVAVTKLDRQLSHRFPFFLPDGRQFLFFAQGTPETAGIYLGSLESGDTKRLTLADTRGVYLQGLPGMMEMMGGWLVWVRAGTLVAQRLDLEQQALTGDPVTLANPVAFDAGLNVSAVSVSATGLVAYRTGGNSRRQLTWFDRSGKALGTMGAPDENNLRFPNISPDGRRVAVDRTVQGNQDIWLLDGTRTSRFTFDAAQDRDPIWSPDGSRFAFNSNRKGQRDLYQKPSSGAGAEEFLLESSQIKVATDWSADGRFLLYESQDPQTDRDLWVLPLTGERKPWVCLKTNFGERFGRFSPDGRWVAYLSNESGRTEIYIQPFAAPVAPGTTGQETTGQWQVSTVGGIYPVWRRDGKELYYVGPNGEMMAAPITTTGTTLEPGAPMALFPTRMLGGGVDNGQGRQYDVARDGRFLINTVLDDVSSPITLIQNWKPPAQ